MSTAIFTTHLTDARDQQMLRREKIAEDAKRRMESLPEARVILRKITEGGILSTKHLSLLWKVEAAHDRLAQAVMICLGYVKHGQYVSWCITHKGVLDMSALSRGNKDALCRRVEKVFGPLQPTNVERTALAMNDEDLWLFG